MDSLAGYVQNEIAGMDEIELEARALIKTASLLNKVKEDWDASKQDLSSALERNRRLWSVLASAMKEEDCPQPIEIKQNILNLASYVFKRTVEVIAHPTPEKLDILISINMNIAKWLSGKTDGPAPEENV